MLDIIFSSCFPGVNNDVQALGYATASTSVTGRAPSGYVINPTIGPMHRPGPTVHIPGYPTTQPALPDVRRPQPVGRMTQAVGYTAEHAAYPMIRQNRIQEAYSTYNAEVVVVEVRLTVKLPGKVKEILIYVCTVQLLKNYCYELSVIVSIIQRTVSRQ